MWFVLFFLALVPSAILAVLLNQSLSLRPEVLRLMARTVLLGFAVVIPAGSFELIFMALPDPRSVLALIVYSFGVVAVIEQIALTLVLRLGVLEHRDSEGPLDTLLYGMCAAFSFFTLKYLLLLPYGTLSTRLALMVLAVPYHTLLGGLLGYWLGRIKAGSVKPLTGYVGGMAFSILFEGFFVFVVRFAELRVWLIALLPFALLLAAWLFFEYLKRSILESKETHLVGKFRSVVPFEHTASGALLRDSHDGYLFSLLRSGCAGLAVLMLFLGLLLLFATILQFGKAQLSTQHLCLCLLPFTLSAMLGLTAVRFRSTAPSDSHPSN